MGNCFLRMIPGILLVLLLAHGVTQSSAEETDANPSGSAAKERNGGGSGGNPKLSLMQAKNLCKTFLGRSPPELSIEQLEKFQPICKAVQNSGLSEADFQNLFQQYSTQYPQLLEAVTTLYELYPQYFNNPDQTSTSKHNEAVDNFTTDAIVAMVFGVLVAVGRWSLSLCL